MGDMKLTINGVEMDVEVAEEQTLAELLRGELGLTGTKIGCGDGQCGSCTVLLDSRPVRSCIFPARRAAGKTVLTIEGLADSWGRPGELHPLQTAFIEHGAVQCGFCTPGLLMVSAGLWHKLTTGALETVSDDDIVRALGRNSCRCTGYASVIRAIRSAVHYAQTGEHLEPLPIEVMPTLEVIGHSPPRPDVVGKVTGRALYTDDYRFPGMLMGATLRASVPHGVIRSIDTTRAEALPGVHAVLTHRDVPGRNLHGLVYTDWPVLCGDKIRYLGDAIAIVAADSEARARQALEAIEVVVDPLPVVGSAVQARELDAALVHEERPAGNLLEHIKVRHGDVEAGLADSDVIVEREYHTPIYEHMFMEPECSIGVPPGTTRSTTS